MKRNEIANIIQKKYSTLDLRKEDINYYISEAYNHKHYDFDCILYISNILDKKIEEFKSKFSIIENKNYNIIFFRNYFRINSSEFILLCDFLNTTPDDLSIYVFRGKKINSDILIKICDFYNVYSYNELKKLILSKAKKILIDEKADGIYDISFLYDYFVLNNISIYEFSKSTDLSIHIINLCLQKKQKLNEDEIKKVLDYFNVENYEMLLFKYTKNTIVKKKKYDISFLKQYIIYFNISKEEICNKIDKKVGTFNNYLRGKCLISEQTLNILLEYFNVNSYEDLKILCEEKCKEYESINSDVIMDYYYSYKINIDELMILLLLYGGIVDNNYSEDNISQILNINKDKILKVKGSFLKNYRNDIYNKNKLLSKKKDRK